MRKRFMMFAILRSGVLLCIKQDLKSWAFTSFAITLFSVSGTRTRNFLLLYPWAITYCWWRGFEPLFHRLWWKLHLTATAYSWLLPLHYGACKARIRFAVNMTISILPPGKSFIPVRKICLRSFIDVINIIPICFLFKKLLHCHPAVCLPCCYLMPINPYFHG